jgi:hypothetical protein
MEHQMNTVTLTGQIKNIQTKENGNWKIKTASFSQYAILDSGKTGCVFTFPIVFTQARLGLADGLTPNENGVIENVKLTGRLVTNFDRRKDVENKDRRKPWTQIEVQELVLSN